MSRTTLEIIRPFLAVNYLPDREILPRLIAVHDGVFGHPSLFPNTPFDEPTFKGAIDRFATALAAVLTDGGKLSLEERNKTRAEAVVMYRTLGHYVENACKNDMNTFLSSGFTPVAKPQRIQPQPLPAPEAPTIKQGPTGEFAITSTSVPQALYYELSCVPVSSGGDNVEPTTVIVTSTQQPTIIKNLTPGTIYKFQIRAFGKLGFSAWSSATQRMVI
jgi:hypothetical protein